VFCVYECEGLGAGRCAWMCVLAGGVCVWWCEWCECMVLAGVHECVCVGRWCVVYGVGRCACMSGVCSAYGCAGMGAGRCA